METLITDQRSWTRQDVAELLVSRTALTELDMADALSVVALMAPKRIKAGGLITQEGFTNTEYMYLILQGEVLVENEFAKKSDSMVISVLSTGAIVGELGIMDGEPRSATCTAITEVDAAVLSRDRLAHLIREQPRAASNLLAALLKRVSDKLRATNKKVRTLTIINRSLLEELESYKNPNAG